jgi:ABC-type polysaccharide/polyol phosphate export permease
MPLASPSRLSKAARDLLHGFLHWELWWLLALNDIRQRYRRSRLGQFWITVAMAVFIGTIGYVYSHLFRTELKDYLPYLTVNVIVWGFISGTLTDACTAFTQAENFLRQEALPKTAFLLRVLLRNMIVLGHNVVIVPFVFLIVAAPVTGNALLALIGILLIVVNLFFASMFVSVICTRFRDMPQIIATFLQIGFFVSPVMWQKTQIPAEYAFILDFNPFAHHLIVVAEPLLGNVPALYHYAACLFCTLALAALSVPFFIRFRERIIYWL